MLLYYLYVKCLAVSMEPGNVQNIAVVSLQELLFSDQMVGFYTLWSKLSTSVAVTPRPVSSSVLTSSVETVCRFGH